MLAITSHGLGVVSCARTNARERDTTARQAGTVLEYSIFRRWGWCVDVATNQRYYLVFIRVRAQALQWAQ
jgi:hypothetical protein